MEDGAGTSGRSDGGAGVKGLPRQSSAARLNQSGMRANYYAMNASRVNALRASVNRHTDSALEALLSSKEALAKKSTIEAAFRACRDVFLEVSAVLIDLLDERALNSPVGLSAGDVKRAVVEALDGYGTHNIFNNGRGSRGDGVNRLLGGG